MFTLAVIWRGAGAAERTGFENQRGAIYRGFKSLPLRQVHGSSQMTRQERCPSGLRSTLGKRVCRNPAPRVQIPPSPPSLVRTARRLLTDVRARQWARSLRLVRIETGQAGNGAALRSLTGVRVTGSSAVPCIFLGFCLASSRLPRRGGAPRESSRTCSSQVSLHAGWAGRLRA